MAKANKGGKFIPFNKHYQNKKLPEYTANDLLGFTEEQIWKLPKAMEMTFADGVVMQVTARRVLLSWHTWRLHRDYPGCGVLSTHYVGNGRFVNGTLRDLLGAMFWDVYENHTATHDLTVWEMSKTLYEIVNTIHNITVADLSEYVTTTDLGDIADILLHRSVETAKSNAMERISNSEDGSDVLKDTFVTIAELMSSDDKTLRNNGIAKMVRAGLLDKNQLLQFIGPRGFVKSTDGTMYPEPIYAGYADGLRNLYDSMTESRSASLALYMNQAPLQDSEYFNRQMQLLAAVISGVGQDDCGTTQTIPWLVDEVDLISLTGKYHMVDGRPVVFNKSDTQYVGKVINVRSITKCENPDPTVVCKTCIGRVHRVIPPRTNLGHFLTIEPLATLSQLILSTKHVVASMASLYMDMSGSTGKWFKQDVKNKSSIKMKRSNIANKFCLRFIAEEASGLNSLNTCDNVAGLLPQRISCVTSIQVSNADHEGKSKGEWETFDTTISGVGSALSTDVLLAIKRNGVTIMGDLVEVVLDDFKDKEVFVTPRRNEDMMSYLKVVKHFVFGAEKNTDKGDSMISYSDPGQAVATLKRIFDEKITVNIIHAEIFVRACMTRIDPNDPYKSMDYNLPIGGEMFRFANAKDIILNRSVTGALAFQGQGKLLTNPHTYLIKDRHKHPLDPLVM